MVPFHSNQHHSSHRKEPHSLATPKSHLPQRWAITHYDGLSQYKTSLIHLPNSHDATYVGTETLSSTIWCLSNSYTLSPDNKLYRIPCFQSVRFCEGHHSPSAKALDLRIESRLRIIQQASDCPESRSISSIPFL